MKKKFFLPAIWILTILLISLFYFLDFNKNLFKADIGYNGSTYTWTVSILHYSVGWWYPYSGNKCNVSKNFEVHFNWKMLEKKTNFVWNNLEWYNSSWSWLYLVPSVVSYITTDEWATEMNCETGELISSNTLSTASNSITYYWKNCSNDNGLNKVQVALFQAINNSESIAIDEINTNFENQNINSYGDSFHISTDTNKDKFWFTLTEFYDYDLIHDNNLGYICDTTKSVLYNLKLIKIKFDIYSCEAGNLTSSNFSNKCVKKNIKDLIVNFEKTE